MLSILMSPEVLALVLTALGAIAAVYVAVTAQTPNKADDARAARVQSIVSRITSMFRRSIPIIAFALLLGACTSVVGPKIDESTGTTLAQRCVDYRAALLAMDAAGESDTEAYAIMKLFVEANCTAVQ